MAKFKAEMLDLVVSTETGFVNFKGGFYTTTKKKEIEALKKAKDVVEIKTPTKSKPIIEKVVEKVVEKLL